jgi:hypothetical protein
MTLQEFQRHSNETAVYHQSLDSVKLQYLALAIAGQGGELASYVKKYWKHGIFKPT